MYVTYTAKTQLCDFSESTDDLLSGTLILDARTGEPVNFSLEEDSYKVDPQVHEDVDARTGQKYRYQKATGWRNLEEILKTMQRYAEAWRIFNESSVGIAPSDTVRQTGWTGIKAEMIAFYNEKDGPNLAMAASDEHSFNYALEYMRKKA